MSFYECYETLCAEHGFKPQASEMQAVAGVSSPSISGWKNGSQPKADVLCRLAKYFGVTVDYLLGLSVIRKSQGLTSQEELLVDVFRACSEEGKFRIIQQCMNERDSTVKKGSAVG